MGSMGFAAGCRWTPALSNEIHETPMSKIQDVPRHRLLCHLMRRLSGAGRLRRILAALRVRRTIATRPMVAMGTLRLALDRWKQNDAAHPLAYYLRQGFTLLA